MYLLINIKLCLVVEVKFVCVINLNILEIKCICWFDLGFFYIFYIYELLKKVKYLIKLI